MTDKYLRYLINKLNAGKTEGLIFLRPLSDLVDYAIVKPKVRRAPTKNISLLELEKCYFIKNNEGLYVAGVNSMSFDIHWFVMAKHRKKGHLTKAMKEIILPHLFQDDEVLKISIDENSIGRKNRIASERVAYNLGFRKLSDSYYGSKYELHFESYISKIDLSGRNTGITKDRLKELQNQIHANLNSLLLIQIECEMKLGTNECSDELKECIDLIRKHPNRIEDIWRDRKITWEG